MPLVVAATPPSAGCSGNREATSVEAASCEPKTDTIPPGAYDDVNDAALFTAEIDGAAEAVPLLPTVTVRDAAAAPLNVAVIVPAPCVNCAALTVRVAVETPAAPASWAVPKVLLPCVNVTVPDGVV